MFVNMNLLIEMKKKKVILLIILGLVLVLSMVEGIFYFRRQQIFQDQEKGYKNKGEWLGKSLSLHLDHINGINNDNRLENLRILCPNCHSLKPTHRGKNRKNNGRVAERFTHNT